MTPDLHLFVEQVGFTDLSRSMQAQKVTKQAAASVFAVFRFLFCGCNALVDPKSPHF
jgi:hypothetical protein